MIPLATFKELGRRSMVGLSLLALLSNTFPAFAQAGGAGDSQTATPIKHVIVIIGENRTFDHVFGTYVPHSGETVSNLLSKGIVKADGSRGPNFALAKQFKAVPPFRTNFFISLTDNEKAPYSILPEPTLNFAPTKTIFPTGTPSSLLAAVEPSLETSDLNLLTT